MAVTAPSRPVPARPSRRRLWMALSLGLVFVIALAVTVTLLTSGEDNPAETKGSGVAASQTRTLPVFTGVDLAGTNEMTVQIGEPQQVLIRADDNLLDKVVTEVRDGVLVVSDRGSFTTRSPMSVVVTVPSLQSATLSGTGLLIVTGVAADTFTARLPGTGTLIVSGRAEHVDASLSGDGTLTMGSLLARDATVSLSGTGNVTIHATRALDAAVSGTGSILYSGHPASVTKNIVGVGSISEG